ncbi:MAG: hypothetical protein K2I74_08015 [Treponemataceae bacterium]|nr:hypothetical protein [Treponemataceae bacterium]
MKVTARMFGVLCAVGMVFCAACDGMGDGGDGKTDGNDAAVYEVGTIVTFEEKQYLVTKNTEAAGMSAKYGTVIVDGNTYYPHEKAAAYHAGLLQKKGVTEYVELYDLNPEQTEENVNAGRFEERYAILHGDRRCYTIKHRWDAARMFAASPSAERIPAFEKLSRNTLRTEWDPSTVIISNHTSIYGSDLSKKSYESYIFGYVGQTIAFEDDNLVRRTESKAYTATKVGEKAIYEIYWTSKNYDNGKNRIEYKLKDPVSDTFFWLYVYEDGTYQLSTNGVGTSGGSNSSDVYKNNVKLSRLYYDASGEQHLDYSVSVKGSSVTDEDGMLTVAVDKEQYLRVSTDMTTVGGIVVPCEITFAALYKDADAPLGKYTQVTFVPKQMFDMVVYEPKTDATYGYDFIRRYADDYQSLYAGASAAQ